MAGLGCQRTNLSSGSCTDPYSCTINDTCSNGVCVGQADATKCTSANPCQSSVCTATGGAGSGCTVSNNTSGCDDELSCTVGDTCSGGTCTPGASNCASGATCGSGGCSCSGGLALCPAGCVDLNTSAANCGVCGRTCPSGSCQAGACKPSTATNCTAARYNNHDYMFCTDALNWTSARTKCRGYVNGANYKFDLVIVDDAAENAFLQSKVNSIAGSSDAWDWCHDRTDQGNSCSPAGDDKDGKWTWVNPSTGSLDGYQFCNYTSASTTNCVSTSGRYENFPEPGQPDNAGCDCSFQFTCLCTKCDGGEDCAHMQKANNGIWNHNQSRDALDYVCESW